MRVYIGFDDTDTLDAHRGTGKLARWFGEELPEPCSLWGVVRQQLLVDDRIPYTSHNSSACVVVDVPDRSLIRGLLDRAVEHLAANYLEGSDPGLCVVPEDTPVLPSLMTYGRSCTNRVLTQRDAMEAARGIHLSGHGGTNDGIIGAAAAVGLTASGWCGRFIEFGGLRVLEDRVRVSDLEARAMRVVSIDRQAKAPAPDDLVLTKGWLRPMLWGSGPVVVVKESGAGIWESLGEKRNKQDAGALYSVSTS